MALLNREIESRMLTVQQSAQYLNVDKNLVVALVKEEKICSVNLGGVRIDKNDLDEFIEFIKNNEISVNNYPKKNNKYVIKPNRDRQVYDIKQRIKNAIGK